MVREGRDRVEQRWASCTADECIRAKSIVCVPWFSGVRAQPVAALGPSSAAQQLGHRTATSTYARVHRAASGGSGAASSARAGIAAAAAVSASPVGAVCAPSADLYAAGHDVTLTGQSGPVTARRGIVRNAMADAMRCQCSPHSL